MWRDDALLLDMLLAARKVREFTAGRTADDFAADRILQSATQYELQIIGEAAGKISEQYQAEHPEIPWRKIIAFRHRLVHDYLRIELPKVWVIVEQHIPPLIAALEALVPPDSPSAD